MALAAGGGGSSDYVPSDQRTAALGAGGHFRVEPEQVRALTEGIQQAIDRMDSMIFTIDAASQVGPPGTDPFSQDATTKFGSTASGDGDALLQHHVKFRQTLIDTRNTILANIDAAVGQDSATSSSLRGPS